MNYADQCRSVCCCEYDKEAGLILEWDDTLLYYCSKKCKNKGVKYLDEELKNDTPKTEERAAENNNNNKKSTLTSSPFDDGIDIYITS